MVQGYKVPVFSESESWSLLDSEERSSVHLKRNNVYYTEAELEEYFSILGEGRWFERASRLMEHFVTGQLKNLIVALLTTSSSHKKIKVALIGSKAAEGSGIWVPHFARILCFTHKEVEIHCYDIHEKESDTSGEIAGSRVRIIRHSKLYPEDQDGREFDCVVDDSYLPSATERVPLRNWKSRWWSKKKHYGKSIIENVWSSCFHPVEARQFSKAIDVPEARYTTCGCSICRVADFISSDKSEYESIRTIFSMYGGPSCNYLTVSHDSQLYDSFYSKLSQGGIVTMETVAEKRVVEAISSIIPVSRISKTEVKSNTQLDCDMECAPLHINNMSFIYDRTVYPHFQSKCVQFLGVNPMVLGGTDINKSNTTQQRTEIAFISDPAMFSSVLNVLEVWSEKDPSFVYGREHNGKVHMGYKCYVKKRLPVYKKEISQFLEPPFYYLVPEREYTVPIPKNGTPAYQVVHSSKTLTVYEEMVVKDLRTSEMESRQLLTINHQLHKDLLLIKDRSNSDATLDQILNTDPGITGNESAYSKYFQTIPVFKRQPGFCITEISADQQWFG